VPHDHDDRAEPNERDDMPEHTTLARINSPLMLGGKGRWSTAQRRPQAAFTYDRKTVVLHWCTAVLVGALWLIAQIIDDFPGGRALRPHLARACIGSRPGHPRHLAKRERGRAFSGSVGQDGSRGRYRPLVALRARHPRGHLGNCECPGEGREYLQSVRAPRSRSRRSRNSQVGRHVAWLGRECARHLVGWPRASGAVSSLHSARRGLAANGAGAMVRATSCGKPWFGCVERRHAARVNVQAGRRSFRAAFAGRAEAACLRLALPPELQSPILRIGQLISLTGPECVGSFCQAGA
jgi:hypothetical protein